jgi:hypothetical protein
MRRFSSYGPVNVNVTNRATYEQAYRDCETGVTVRPVFVETGT